MKKDSIFLKIYVSGKLWYDFGGGLAERKMITSFLKSRVSDFAYQTYGLKHVFLCHIFDRQNLTPDFQKNS